MLKILSQRRLDLSLGLEYCSHEKRWRLRTAKGVAEILQGDDYKKIDYYEVARPVRGYEYELKARLKLYDIIEQSEFANNPEKLIPYLYALALEQAKKRREGKNSKAIEAAILAGEAAAAASILSNYMEAPTNNEQAVG